MPMGEYPVVCQTPGCGQTATFKIASRWSDGITGELKTYALSCRECLAGHLVRSRAKQAACRLAAGETLETPGVYETVRGRRDRQLTRRPDLEAETESVEGS